MLRRHQLGGDREGRGHHAAGANAGQEAQDDQLLGALHQRDHQCQQCRQENADQHDALAAQMVGHGREKEAAEAQRESRAGNEYANIGVGQVQRRLGQHQERAGHHQIVALDKADEGEDDDDQDVIGAEGNAVELLSEHAAGVAARTLRNGCCTHGVTRVGTTRAAMCDRTGRRDRFRFCSEKISRSAGFPYASQVAAAAAIAAGLTCCICSFAGRFVAPLFFMAGPPAMPEP